MTVFMIVLGAIAVIAIAGSVVLINRDGYRRIPTRPSL